MAIHKISWVVLNYYRSIRPLPQKVSMKSRTDFTDLDNHHSGESRYVRNTYAWHTQRDTKMNIKIRICSTSLQQGIPIGAIWECMTWTFLKNLLQEQTWIFGFGYVGGKGSRKVIKVLSTSNIPFNVIQLFSDGGFDLE